MAFSKCPGCENPVPMSAVSCPHCGCTGFKVTREIRRQCQYCGGKGCISCNFSGELDMWEITDHRNGSVVSFPKGFKLVT